MKKIRKIAVFLLAFATLITSVSVSVFATENENTPVLSENEISRAQWLSELAKAFEMTVEDDMYPDNYFSDLDAESEYYYDILLNVEFGVIDVPAGGAIRPDDPATREFAVDTLNFCLGYELDEDVEYTFSDAEQCENPKNAQVAVNRGWLELKSEMFEPDAHLTKDEAKIMLDDAKSVLAQEVVDEDYDSTYEFKSDVKVVACSDVEIAIDETSITITDLATELAAGDKFAVYDHGVPYVARAVSLQKNGNQTIVQIAEVADEDAYETIDAQGVAEVDYTQVEALGTAEIVFVDNETGEEYEDAVELYAAAEARGVAKLDATIKAKDKLTLANGLSVAIEATIKNTKVYYGIDWSNVSTYVYLDTTADVSYTIKGDIAGFAGLDDIPILFIGVPGVGGFTLSVNLEASGSVSSVTTYYVKSGVSFSLSEGFRQIKTFKSKAFSVVAEATAGVGATTKLGVTQLPVIGAYIYADGGARIGVKHIKNKGEVSPAECVHFAAYVYADYGATAEIDFGVFGKYEKTLECVVYDEDNSPFRIVHHYEDGVEVPQCTRGHGDPYNYFTCNDSIFCGSGYSKGTSSGLTRSGEPVIIYKYRLDSEDNAIITKFTGNPSSLVIPSSIDGHTIVGIDKDAVKGNVHIRSVIIPDTVTFIGRDAFANCTFLSNVKLSANLEELGEQAFGNCQFIQSIEIPKSLVSCDAGYTNLSYTGYTGPFYGCSSLKYVTFEEGITAIPHRVFAGCNGLQNITIPETVTSIGEKAFGECDNLRQVVIPQSVTKIGFSAFRGCDSLTKVQMGNAVEDIGSCVFEECTALDTVNLSKKLKYMGENVFGNCTSLEEITIPKSLEECSSGYKNLCYTGYTGPFAGCSSLKTVHFEEGITSIPHRVFAGCTGIEMITIPDTVTFIGEKAFGECDNLKEIVIPENVTEIKFASFYSCDNLKKVKISNSVKKIGGCVFENCEMLDDVTLSSRLESMGGDAFKNCVSLTKIWIPKSLKTCNGGYTNLDYTSFEGPFNGCSSLKEFVFEEGTTVIAHRLFASCTGVEEVTIPDTVVEIGEKAFAQCSSLKKITIPDAVTKIGFSAFYECKSLEQIKLPPNITAIPRSTFRYCASLKEIEIPEYVTVINANAFEGSGLETLTIKDAKITIDSGVFRNCDALTKVDLGSQIVEIKDSAFNDCDVLTEISIPNSVTRLGNNCFEHCDLLANVTLGTGITAIPNYAFNQCGKLDKVNVPYRVKTIGSYAFANCPSMTGITIPRGTTAIQADAFSYPDKLTIYGIAGTYAETFANENGIKFVNQEVPVTDVSLDHASLKLNRGEKKTLVLTISPADSTDEITWRSSDETVVTIDETGLVTAKNVGTATIKVNAGAKSASCKVTVVQPVTSISLNKTSISLESAQTYQLNATVRPANADNQAITWTSSDEAVATVDENGLISAVSKGTATITVEAQDGSQVKNTCKVTVVNNGYFAETVNELESLHNYEDSCTDFWVYTVDGAEALKVVFDDRTEMEEDFDYLYLYDAENKEVGKYTGKELAGKELTITGDTIKIKIVSDDAGNAWGFRVTSVVEVTLGCEHEWGSWHTVTDATYSKEGIKRRECGLCGEYEEQSIPVYKVTSIKMNISEKNASVGDIFTLEVTCSPIAPAKNEVVWTTSNTNVATVDSNGKVTVKGEGNAVITASVGGQSTICKITVETNEPHMHDYTGAITKEATCTEDGEWTYTCGCGDFYTEVISKTGHNWSNWTVVKAPTYTEEGKEERSCQNCDEKESRPIDKLEKEPISNPFTDVPADQYYYQPVLWAVANNITNGTSATTFEPDKTCTRGQIVTFLWRAMGSVEPTSTDNPFTDVPSDQYYYKAVLWAVENGITTGTGAGKFSPDNTCTRDQVVTFLWRAMGKPEPASTKNPFTDVPSGEYYYKPVLWAVEEGITTGTSKTTFGPAENCTRGHVVTFLYRTLAE